MRKLVLSCLVNALALLAASYIIPGVSVNNLLTLLGAGILLGIINLFIRPVVLLLTIPLNLLTLGLFILVVNTWMVMLTALFIHGLRIQGFTAAFFTALLVSIFNWLIRDLKDKKS
ncbi:MAG TPA: phage holin family protein [Desulfitobacteriaceae bacterium]|jgi:putative membrane protein|nr:phage holin family protein [Desulfitobacteriaceae bacterium]